MPTRRHLTVLFAILALAIAAPVADAAVGDLKEYTGPIAVSTAGLSDIAAGPNGNLWFTEYHGGKIGKLDPRSGAVTEYAAGCNQPDQIVLGADGNLWYTCADGGLVGRITPLGVATAFVTGVPVPGDIISGPDGNLWFTASGAYSKVIKLATDGSIPATYPVGNGANGLTVGGDGSVWVSMNNERNVVRITTSGVITNFATPEQPYAITTGPFGNVWIGNGQGASGMWRMGADGQVTATFPTSEDPVSMTRGPSGNIWFTADGAKKYVGRVTTAGSLTTYSTGLAAGANPQGVTAGPDGNVWFVTNGQSHVYRVLTGTVPINTIAPTLSGKTAIGSTLSADPGGWQYQPTSYAYRWERCTSASGTGCTVISGKTASTYTTTTADSGAYIRVGVSATNANGGSARVYSAALTADRLPDNSGGSSTNATNGTNGPLGPIVGPTLLGNETIGSIVGTSARITTAVKVTAAGHLAQSARASGLVVCRASANPTKAGTVKLVCQLSARAKAILHQRALRISVTTTFTPTGFPTVAVTRMIKIPRTAGATEPVVG